jgi:hypothetical protein
MYNSFYFQPNIRLPFEVFVMWVQLEINKQNFEFAAEILIKPYISKSNIFINDKSKSIIKVEFENKSNKRPWL